jgi:two-component system OmpR family response regulator
MHILIVEDDRLLSEAIADSLHALGVAMSFAYTGAEAWDALQQGGFDLLVLDIGLPGLSGLDVLQRLRQKKATTPVLMLTARDALEDRVRGLDLGADDYMVKPFAPRELEARARALLRRSRGQPRNELTHGALRLDVAAKRAWLHEQPLELSAREWQLLLLFVERAGRILDKDTLIDTLCGKDDAITQNAIEVYVSRLRSKLGSGGITLRTVRGLGYLLDNAPS